MTCEFHCFADGNKRLAITLSAQFLLFNGYMSVAKNFFAITENISYHVAAGKINKDLLRYGGPADRRRPGRQHGFGPAQV